MIPSSETHITTLKCIAFDELQIFQNKNVYRGNTGHHTLTDWASHTTRLSNHSEHNTETRGLLLEHTTNDGNIFYKISSKYHTGLISDDWIQSQSVHMIIHYTTCGQICRLTLPDRGKNLYSQQNCIPALITTESVWHGVGFIKWHWSQVPECLCTLFQHCHGDTGWLDDWTGSFCHTIQHLLPEPPSTSLKVLCAWERERWQDILKRYTAVTTLLPTHDMVKKRRVSRHGSVQSFEVVHEAFICSKIQ